MDKHDIELQAINNLINKLYLGLQECKDISDEIVEDMRGNTNE